MAHITESKKMPVIEITWVDAMFDPEDSADLEDAEAAEQFGSLPVCQDYGLLMRWNKELIVLATSRCKSDNEVRHSCSIPRSLVRGIRVLDGELPCHLNQLIPATARRISTTSPPGSSPTSEPTSPSTKARSSTRPRRPRSKR